MQELYVQESLIVCEAGLEFFSGIFYKEDSICPASQKQEKNGSFNTQISALSLQTKLSSSLCFWFGLLQPWFPWQLFPSSSQIWVAFTLLRYMS